jgi:hypothetical protein
MSFPEEDKKDYLEDVEIIDKPNKFQLREVIQERIAKLSNSRNGLRKITKEVFELKKRRKEHEQPHLSTSRRNINFLLENKRLSQDWQASKIATQSILMEKN